MAAPFVPLDEEAVVKRLRAAGCVFAEDEARLLLAEAATSDAIADMVRRRTEGRPLEHILGWVEFCGLRIAVEPGVFVPRRRTELLVREAAALAPPHAVVVDLCCGSGAVAAALTATLDGAAVYAADIDPLAVACARRNLEPTGGRVFEGDLFQPLPSVLFGRVDIVSANVPYVPTAALSTMPPEARDFEPRVALDGGADGLDVMRRVGTDASRWLAPGGHLLVETSEAQADLAVEILGGAGLAARVSRSPELGATVVIAVR